MKGRQFTAADVIAQVLANGYKRKAYKERDGIRHRGTYIKMVRKDQGTTLKRYIM